jgi:hypothetical protein
VQVDTANKCTARIGTRMYNKLLLRMRGLLSASCTVRDGLVQLQKKSCTLVPRRRIAADMATEQGCLQLQVLGIHENVSTRTRSARALTVHTRACGHALIMRTYVRMISHAWLKAH